MWFCKALYVSRKRLYRRNVDNKLLLYNQLDLFVEKQSFHLLLYISGVEDIKTLQNVLPGYSYV